MDRDLQNAARARLARIIHHLRGASLGIRHHSTFASLTNTGSIRSVTESDVIAKPLAIRSLSGELSRLAVGLLTTAAVCIAVGLTFGCSREKDRSTTRSRGTSRSLISDKQKHKTSLKSISRGAVIDSHTLIAPIDESIDLALAVFKRVGVTKFCNKNGGYLGSTRFKLSLRTKQRLKERFEFFANLNWDDVNESDWGDIEAERLEHEVRLGAKGVKIFKALGLGVRDQRGNLLHVDDPRLNPIFERAAQLNAIVAMHTGDPKAFFEPLTKENERYDELTIAPDWSFYGQHYPKRKRLLEQRDRVIARHPRTTFLLIHLANNPEDIDYVAALLRKYPNVYVDTSARLPEIGRHPVDKVRAFFIEFQDRILFGTDFAVSPYGMQLGSVSLSPPTFDDAVAFYNAHFRFFETDLKQIDHPTPIQGRWKINAIHLPVPVLRKLYYENANKLIFLRRTGSGSR